MVYQEQRSEPKDVWRVVALALKNRVKIDYGGFGGYAGQLSHGQFALISEEGAESLTGRDRQLYDNIRIEVEGVLNGPTDMTGIAVPNAIYFQNTYSQCQSDGLEKLLKDPNGNVGPGNWSYTKRDLKNRV